MKNKVILITGAASGIGAATAQRIAQPGDELILHTGSNAQGLNTLANTLKKQKINVFQVTGDLADLTLIEKLRELIVDRLKRLDVLINNAGYPDWHTFDELNDDSLQTALDINLKAFHRLVRFALPLLQQSNNARIIAVSSFLAHHYQLENTFVPASAASKAALEAMAKSLAMQLAQQSITVNSIVPGYIKKDGINHKPIDKATQKKLLNRIPMKRFGLPAEVAGLINYLISEEASYMTGQSLAIDGGLTV